MSFGWLIVAAALRAQVTNGGFESGLTGWRPLYTRETQAGRVTEELRDVHSGTRAARIEHAGEKDWSFDPTQRVPAKAGDVFELEAWLKLAEPAVATLAVSTWDAAQKVVSWSFGARSTRTASGWQVVRTRFVVPEGVAQIQPRLLGYGPMVALVDDIAIRRLYNVAEIRSRDLPAALRIANPAVEVTCNTRDGTLEVLDRRAGRTWRQRALDSDVVIKQATVRGEELQLTLLHVPSDLEIDARLRLEPNAAEFTLTLNAAGEMPANLDFPPAFAGESRDYLVVPLNEGIGYPVDDPTIPPMRLVAYGGHGICMPFWGLTDGMKGHMAILETPDDVALRLERSAGGLVIQPSWEAQRGTFGYARRLRYVFFSEGGHVAMAKRYRTYARAQGLVRTLEEKLRANANVERLLGAVNVWCWDKDPVAIAQELQDAGIQRILWSNQQAPAGITAMNARGVLTSRYDIYQDVMDPANFPRLQYIHRDWTTAGWPKDLIVDRGGRWIKGWGVETKDGGLISCGVLCDKRAPDYARERVPADLATHPYLGRFIDTTTASPWRECYSPDHPMTRTDSKRAKMELLRYMSETSQLVTGSETGHDAAVPYVHFFEGMMSLGPYRVPDAGRRVQQIWTDVPDRVAKFQLGHAYRLPLFELVYHDCVVSYWYWGDYNNKLPALWDKRDLFNVLYGVPPMFMFDRQLWQKDHARFVQSYQNTCPIVRKVATAEMVDHRFLTPDRDVQQTTFANGISVVVNFGATPYSFPNGETVGPMQYRVR